MGRSHLVSLGWDTRGEWVDTDANDSHDDDDDVAADDESTRFIRFTDDDDDAWKRRRRWANWGIDGEKTVFKERIASDANVAVDAEDDAEDG